MEIREKNTKERILEEALKLFAQSGYMGTSMNDIAAKLGVTKAALYKHYTSKQEILDNIVERMNQMDMERAKNMKCRKEIWKKWLTVIRAQLSIRLNNLRKCSFCIGRRKSFQVAFARC